MKCGAYFPACATPLSILSNIKILIYDFPFNFLKAREQQIVFQVDMLKQGIHKHFQFLHQQTVAGTAILRYGEVIRQLNDVQVAVSFPSCSIFITRIEFDIVPQCIGAIRCPCSFAVYNS